MVRIQGIQLVHGGKPSHTANAWLEIKSYCLCMLKNQSILPEHCGNQNKPYCHFMMGNPVTFPVHGGKPSRSVGTCWEINSYCHFMMGNQGNAPSAQWEAEVYCQCHGRKWHQRTNKSPEAPYASSRLYMMLIKANYGATHAHNSCM
jgi:hypothetical protein